MNEDVFFDGFMPLIDGVTISSQMQSISSSGDLVNINCIKIKTVDGTEYVFSIIPEDLQKLYFLILKTLTN
jgi:hypothetical protein